MKKSFHGSSIEALSVTCKAACPKNSAHAKFSDFNALEGIGYLIF